MPVTANSPPAQGGVIVVTPLGESEEVSGIVVKVTEATTMDYIKSVVEKRQGLTGMKFKFVSSDGKVLDEVPALVHASSVFIVDENNKPFVKSKEPPGPPSLPLVWHLNTASSETSLFLTVFFLQNRLEISIS
jgi:hypothetical protein